MEFFANRSNVIRHNLNKIYRTSVLIYTESTWLIKFFRESPLCYTQIILFYKKREKKFRHFSVNVHDDRCNVFKINELIRRICFASSIRESVSPLFLSWHLEECDITIGLRGACRETATTAAQKCRATSKFNAGHMPMSHTRLREIYASVQSDINYADKIVGRYYSRIPERQYLVGEKLLFVRSGTDREATRIYFWHGRSCNSENVTASFRRSTTLVNASSNLLCETRPRSCTLKYRVYLIARYRTWEARSNGALDGVCCSQSVPRYHHRRLYVNDINGTECIFYHVGEDHRMIIITAT